MPGPTNDRCLLRESNIHWTTDLARTARLRQVPNRPENLDLSGHADLFHRGSAKPQAFLRSKTAEERVSWVLPAAFLNKPLPQIQQQQPDHPPYRRDDGDSSARAGNPYTNYSHTYPEKPIARDILQEESGENGAEGEAGPDYDDAPHSGNSMIVPIGITRSPGHTPSPSMPDLTQSTSGSSSEYTDIEPPTTAGGVWTGGTDHTGYQTIVSHNPDDNVRANTIKTTTSTNPTRRAEGGSNKEGQAAARCRVLNCAGVAYKDGVCMECLEGPDLSMFGDSPRGADAETASPLSDITEHAAQAATGLKLTTVLISPSSSQDDLARKPPCDDLLEQVNRRMTANPRQLPNSLCWRAGEGGKRDVERRAAADTNGSDVCLGTHDMNTDYIKSARNSPAGCAFSPPAVRPVSLTSRFNSDPSLFVQPLRLRQQQEQHQQSPNPHIYKGFTPRESDPDHSSGRANLLPQSRSQPVSVAPSPTFLKSPSFAAQQRLRASRDSSVYRAPFETPTSTRRLLPTEPELLQIRTYTVPLTAKHTGSPGVPSFSTTLPASSTYRTASHERRQQQQQKQRRKAPARKEYAPYESYFEFSSAEPSRNPSRVPSMEFKKGSNNICSGHRHHEIDPSAAAAAVVEQVCTRMGSDGDKGEGFGGGRGDVWLLSEKILPRLPSVYDVQSEEEYPGPCPGMYWF